MEDEAAVVARSRLFWGLMKIVWMKLALNPNSYASIVGIAWAFISNRWHFGMPSIMEGFGTDLNTLYKGSEETIRFTKAFDDSNTDTFSRYVDIFWTIKHALNIGSEAKLRKNIQLIDNFVFKLIHKRTKQVSSSQQSGADGKLCHSDDILPDGFHVKKGDMVAFLPYAMGRMKFLWGEDAEEFKPERWLDCDGTFRHESPFKFTAFQAGPRICLGKEFAYRQMKIFCSSSTSLLRLQAE